MSSALESSRRRHRGMHWPPGSPSLTLFHKNSIARLPADRVN
ncbi:hypothetical protein C4K23_1091 [Pseudomonas chlororaphis]|nr:hypothetical protein C4K23_1091 [Pseudomonas chlororaphis]